MESRPNSTYTTVPRVSDQLLKADTGATASETTEWNDFYTLVRRYCFEFSKTIDTDVQRVFVPYYAIKTVYTAMARDNGELVYNYRNYVLELPDDCLAVDSITFLGTVLTSDQYRLVDSGNSTNGYPYKRVVFNPTGLPSMTYDFADSIIIAGEWGVHDNPTNAYSTVTTTAEALDTSETGVDLANGNGALFDTYEYIRIGDELMFITAITSGVNPAPDVLTVERGVNGFTATTHLTGASITRWNVVSDVALLATKMVAYFFNKRNDYGNQVQVLGNTWVVAQFSEEISAIAMRRRRSKSGVA